MNPKQESKVPLYKQTTGYTCGPASLVMVLGNLDSDIEIGHDLEVALWQDANLKESKATSSYGLALAALKKGYGARVYANGEGIGFIERLMEHFPATDRTKITQRYELQKRECRKLGVEEIAGKTELEDIKAELENGCRPIVLISSKMMGDWVGIPHWVVVGAIDDKKVRLNNPETAKTETYSTKQFLKYHGWGDQTRTVCVFNL